MRKKVTAFLIFLASSQGIAIAEDVFTPTKPIEGYSWLQQLSAYVERLFIWL